jgi:arylsulfatase A-like enzyme
MVITIDCLRADWLKPYGMKEEYAPEVTRLAAEGTVFENCTAQAPWTIPSMASMLTSLYPTTIWTFDNIHRLDTQYTTMTERFRDAGYVTGGFIAHGVIAIPGVGLLQGFDSVNGGALVREKANFAELIPALFEFMQRNRDRPMFLWLHFMELHGPTTRGNPHLQGMPKYGAEIRYMSDHLSRIFAEMKTLGIYDDTIIAFTGDHGEHLGAPHNLVGHQNSVYQELLHVPLILAGPGVPAGKRVPGIVELNDLAPTLYEMTGTPAPDAIMQGFSMLPLVRDEADSIREYAFCERYYLKGQHHMSVRDQRWKIYAKIPCQERLGREPLDWTIDDPGVTVMLFDLENDPQELKDLSGDPSKREILENLKWRLEDFREKQQEFSRLGGGSLETADPEVIAGLRALGYIGGDEELPERRRESAGVSPTPTPTPVPRLW